MKNLFISLMALLCFLVLLAPISYISKGNSGNPVAVDTTDAEPLSDYHNDIVNYWTGVYAKQYNIPEKLMQSIFYQESRFEENDPKYNAHIVGDGGRSFGVGQVQVPTAKYVWKDTNVVVSSKELKYNIKFNIETSTKLISLLRDKYSNAYRTEKEMWLAVLTTYNSGKPERFNKYAFEVYNRYKKS